MEPVSLYWGILGAGKISHDFVNALNDPSGPAAQNNKVVAVAARSHDRAADFAQRHGIVTVYDSYEKLSTDENINIIYIGNTTGQHYDACKLMLNAGKHVLCEKSLTWNAHMCRELFDLATSKKLFLMEALWSNFFPAYKYIKECIHSGSLGKIDRLEASFGIEVMEVPRLNQRDLGGGASLDLGIYLVNLVRLVFNREKPTEIIAKGNLFSTGVDENWDAVLVFEGGRRAVLKCNASHLLKNSALISGSSGYIEIPEPFYCPEQLIMSSGEPYHSPLPSKAKHDYNFSNSSGLSYQVAAIYDVISQGALQCKEYTAEDTLYCAEILDEIRKQIGAKFELDKW